MTTFTIAWDHPRQLIDGFGVHGAFHQARNLRRFAEADQKRMLDTLFSTEADGAGFSMVRNIIGDSGEWGDDVNGPTPSIWPQPGAESHEGDDDQLWFMREARTRGCDRFVSTAWSPPAWMKTTGSVVNGALSREHYRDFAEYLAAYVRIYRDVHGIDLFAISPANEPDFAPDYSACQWTGAEFAEFYRDHLGPVWEREGLGTLTFGPETIGFNRELLETYRDLFLDREASRHLDIVAMHGYENLEVRPLDPRYVGDKRVWMSELGVIGNRDYQLDATIDDAIVNAIRVHDYLTIADVNAFIYFWGISYLKDHNAALIELDLASMTWIPAKRTYALGQYSRFVRPGSRRFEAAIEGNPSVVGSAYRDPQGRAVLVLVNTATERVPVRLDGRKTELGELDQWVTDAERNLVLNSADRTGDNVVIPARSVTTFRER